MIVLKIWKKPNRVTGKFPVRIILELFAAFLSSVPSQMPNFLAAPGDRLYSSSGGMPGDQSWMQLDVTKAGEAGQLRIPGNKSSSKG